MCRGLRRRRWESLDRSLSRISCEKSWRSAGKWDRDSYAMGGRTDSVLFLFDKIKMFIVEMLLHGIAFDEKILYNGIN